MSVHFYLVTINLKDVTVEEDQANSNKNDEAAEQDSSGKTQENRKFLVEWKKLKPRDRQIWIDRYLAEKQLHGIENGENLDDFMPVNDYAEFLFDTIKIKTDISDEKMDELFNIYKLNYTDAMGQPPNVKKVHKEEDNQTNVSGTVSKEENSLPVKQEVPKKAPRKRLESIFK